MVAMKVIVYPGNRKDEFEVKEESTVQDLRNHIAEFLQFIGSRSPNPNTFKMWQMHPLLELDRPLLTLRELLVSRECVLLVMPPDVKPPPISSYDQVEQVLSALHFSRTENNTESSNNGSSTAKKPRKANQTKNKKGTKEKTKKPAESDEFVETKQYTCKICRLSFGSKGGARTHHTRKHKNKDTTENVIQSRSVAPEKARRRNHAQPKKNTKVNQNNVTINYTVTNTVNYNYGSN